MINSINVTKNAKAISIKFIIIYKVGSKYMPNKTNPEINLIGGVTRNK